jgi:hypothetical protein
LTKIVNTFSIELASERIAPLGPAVLTEVKLLETSEITAVPNKLISVAEANNSNNSITINKINTNLIFNNNNNNKRGAISNIKCFQKLHSTL